jgi:hypothetical protein
VYLMAAQMEVLLNQTMSLGNETLAIAKEYLLDPSLLAEEVVEEFVEVLYDGKSMGEVLLEERELVWLGVFERILSWQAGIVMSKIR